MRKAFNFYRSYYEIALKLSPKDRAKYLMAILELQFEGTEPTDLTGMAEFAFLSQKHSLYKQLEGYKHGLRGGAPPKGEDNHTLTGDEQPPHKGMSNQVQGKVQVQGEEKVGSSDFVSLLEMIKKILGKTFRSKKEEGSFLARLKEGFTLEQFELALQNIKNDSYHKETNYKHITPEFICRIDKLEKFINAKLAVAPLQNVDMDLKYGNDND